VSTERVGTCSICGGSVYGWRGAWMSINPPLPDKCSQCSAVAALDVIKMVPAPGRTNARGTALNIFEAAYVDWALGPHVRY
jgi:hypothetical protein